jgi:hypothetical protein
MTPYEALCKHEGYRKRELNEWHRARFIAHRVLLGLGAKCEIEDVLRLEDDTPPMSSEEKQEILSMLPKHIVRSVKK